MNKAYILRLFDGKHRIWIMFDEERTIRGKPGESSKALIARWRKDKELSTITRYMGIHRPSEAAMTIGDIQHPKPKG